MVFDLKVSEEDDGGVGAQEDEYVPTAVQVREPDTGPELAKEPVADPGEYGQRPEDDDSVAQVQHSQVLLHLKLLYE